MRLTVLACVVLAATPAFADALAVSKKVTKLETKDKTVTKTDVLIATPSVNACFTAPVELDVDIQADAGKVTSVKTGQADKKLASCLEDAFRNKKMKGTFTATVHFAAKPDPRLVDDKTIAALEKIDSSKLSTIDTSSGSGSGGTGTGVAGDFTSPPGTAPQTVTTGAPEGTLGDYTADDINRVVKSRAAVLKSCYQMTLKQQPKLAGTFKYEIKIDKTGAVSSAKLKSSTAKSTKLDQCLRAQLLRLKFEAKGKTAVVVYPFVFASQ